MRAPLRLVLFLVAVLALGACEYSEIDGVGTRTANEEFPPQSDLERFEGCSPADLGQWRASGLVTNHSPATATYEVKVAFFADDVRVGERSDWITDLRPGESGEISRSWWVESESDITSCEVLLINRWG